MKLTSKLETHQKLIKANDILLDWYNDRYNVPKRKEYESNFLYKVMCIENRKEVSKWFAPLNVYCRLIDCYNKNDDEVWRFVTSKYNKCVEDIIRDEERLI